MSYDSHASARPALHTAIRCRSTNWHGFAWHATTALVRPPSADSVTRSLGVRSTFDLIVRTHPSPITTRDPVPPPDVHVPRTAPVPPTDIGSPHVRFSPGTGSTSRMSGSRHRLQRQSDALTSTLQQITSQGWLSDPLPIALEDIYCNNL